MKNLTNYCKRGHEYTSENTKWDKIGRRICIACVKMAYVVPRHKVRPEAERFWEKVDKTPGHGPKGDCWLWTGHIGKKHGYGTFSLSISGKKVMATRYCFELVNQTLLGRNDACHTCDNRACVNPAHLWSGTRQQNMDDMIAKHRHHRHKVTCCKWGHEYTPENTRIELASGKRVCRTCVLINGRRDRAKRKERQTLQVNTNE